MGGEDERAGVGGDGEGAGEDGAGGGLGQAGGFEDAGAVDGVFQDDGVLADVEFLEPDLCARPLGILRQFKGGLAIGTRGADQAEAGGIEADEAARPGGAEGGGGEVVGDAAGGFPGAEAQGETAGERGTVGKAEGRGEVVADVRGLPAVVDPVAFALGTGFATRDGGFAGAAGCEGCELFEAREFLAELHLGVFVGVADDADGPLPSAGVDDAEEVEFLVAGPEGDDLPARAIALPRHAVEVERQEVGLEDLQLGGEVADVVVGVVEVVDDADVGVAGGAKASDDLDLVGGFAEPPEVVVEGDGAPESARLGAEGGQGGNGTRDLLLEARGVGLRFGAHGDPELGMDLLPFDAFQDGAGLGVQGGREPPGADLDVAGAHGVDLGVEGRDVFGAPVVGETLDAEVGEHGGAFLRAALLRIKGDDAPRDEIGTRKVSGRRQGGLRWRRGKEGCRTKETGEEAHEGELEDSRFKFQACPRRGMEGPPAEAQRRRGIEPNGSRFRCLTRSREGREEWRQKPRVFVGVRASPDPGRVHSRTLVPAFSPSRLHVFAWAFPGFECEMRVTEPPGGGTRPPMGAAGFRRLET